MKRFLAFVVVCVFFASAAFAAHPLIGKWKFKMIIGGVTFYDYVTINAVNTTTKKVTGYITGVTSYKLTGYYNGNIVYLRDNFADYYSDGYYFTFQGTVPFRKHVGICSVTHDHDTYWNALAIAKLSSSITSTETRTLSDLLYQKTLKKQAQLRANVVTSASAE